MIGKREWDDVIGKVAKHKSSSQSALVEFRHGPLRLPETIRERGVDADVPANCR